MSIKDPSTQDPTPNPTGVFATLQARDAEAMLSFLLALGFVENVVHREGGQILHAQLDWPAGGAVMFGGRRPGRPWSREPGTAGTYLVAEDIDDVYARAESTGAEIIRPLQGTDYGAREFTLRDAEGNLWSIGTYPGEPRDAHRGPTR